MNVSITAELAEETLIFRVGTKVAVSRSEFWIT